MCLLIPGHLFVVWGLGPVGLRWVMGPQVRLAVGWVGLDQLFGGLGGVWVDEMDPWTTLRRWVLGFSEIRRGWGLVEMGT